MKIFYTLYLSILVIIAGTFLRFIDLHSGAIEWISNILLIAGSLLCLSAVFKYIKPETPR